MLVDHILRQALHDRHPCRSCLWSSQGHSLVTMFNHVPVTLKKSTHSMVKWRGMVVGNGSTTAEGCNITKWLGLAPNACLSLVVLLAAAIAGPCWR